MKAVVDSKGSDKPQPGLHISQDEYNPLREELRRPRADAGPPGWDPLQGPPRIGGADLDPLGTFSIICPEHFYCSNKLTSSFYLRGFTECVTGESR